MGSRRATGFRLEFTELLYGLPDVVSVASGGIATLLKNHYTTLEIMAKDVCGSNLNATIDAYANLEPEVYDVDLGSRYMRPLASGLTAEPWT